jgi:ribonuclease HI
VRRRARSALASAPLCASAPPNLSISAIVHALESTAAQCASIPTSADYVAQERTMTEERKREQKPWYPHDRAYARDT